MKKRLISKDAPASVFQHLVLNFGWKEEETLKIVNLQSEDTWYDIYTILIKKWKNEKIKTIKEEEKNILDIFDRKSLKKIIMTSNYGVGYETAESYFKNIILKKKEDKDFIENNWKNIKLLLKDFFNFITNLLILEKNPNEVISYINQECGILSLSDAIIDLNYYEKKTYIIDIQHQAMRYTKSFNGISTNKNNEKFETATRANYIHSLDAALTRWVIRKNGIFTIHDCFLIDPANITYIVSLINEGMACKFDNYNKTNKQVEIFSIFIVI